MSSNRLKILEEQKEFLVQNNAPESDIKEVEQKIKRSKQGKRSKAKGGEYERNIAKIFMNKFPMLELVKTPSSGGFQKASTNEELRGDVSNVNRDYRFMLHLEAKNCAIWKLKDWLEQATNDCPKDKYPSVVFHQQQKIENGKVVQKPDDFICMRIKDFLCLVDKEKIIQKLKQKKRIVKRNE